MTAITSANEKRKMRKSLNDLKDQTRDDYRSLAEHFYEVRMNGQPPTPKRIRDALRAAALEYRPGYWRKLRNAIMYNQVERNHFDSAASVKSIYNPVTSPKTDVDEEMSKSVGGKPGKAQKRLKRLSDSDLEDIYSEVMQRDDEEVGAALLLAQITGCRPAEMLNIQCLKDGSIFIEGAKKTEKGDRGLDRYLEVTEEEWMRVRDSVATLRAVEPGKAGTMHKVQDRLNTVVKSIWPSKKIWPTLYSFRYSMGSELKASGLSRLEIAYIMGHQSMQSVDRYGNKRSGSGKTPIRPAPGANMSSVREGFKTPFQKAQKAPKQKSTHNPGPSMG
jgi:integrase